MVLEGHGGGRGSVWRQLHRYFMPRGIFRHSTRLLSTASHLTARLNKMGYMFRDASVASPPKPPPPRNQGDAPEGPPVVLVHGFG